MEDGEAILEMVGQATIGVTIEAAVRIVNC